MADLNITGNTLDDAAHSLLSAEQAFTEAGSVTAAANYGAENVEAAVCALARTLLRASGSSGEHAAAGASWATSTHTSFVALDRKLAASAAWESTPT